MVDDPLVLINDLDHDFGDEFEYGVVEVKEVEIGSSHQYKRPRRMNNGQLQRKELAVYHPTPKVVIAKRPTIASRELTAVAREQGAAGLWEALQDYVDTVEPDLTYQLKPTLKIGVWPYFKLTHPPLPFAPLVGSLVDFVRATPARANANGEQTREAKYDTVLIEEYPKREGIYHEFN
ncbi:hypothetical protein V565_296540, partial [Rhizoctonia solani 123E]